MVYNRMATLVKRKKKKSPHFENLQELTFLREDLDKTGKQAL